MNESRGICVSEAIVSLFCFIGLPTQPSDNVGILMYFTYLCVGVYVLYVYEIDMRLHIIKDSVQYNETATISSPFLVNVVFTRLFSY